MKKIFKALFLLVALSLAVPVFAQPDFDATKARAEAGDASAQRMLGRMYRDGDGVSLDDLVSLRWFRLAAEQGDVSAQLALGEMYDIGLSVEEDDQEAVNWYRAAAAQGNSRAQYLLGIKNESGNGTTQNYLEAYIWLSVSAAQGEEFAAETRDRVGVLLSKKSLEQAQLKATRCFESNFKDCE